LQHTLQCREKAVHSIKTGNRRPWCPVLGCHLNRSTQYFTGHMGLDI
jgi:hypothetical protein